MLEFVSWALGRRKPQEIDKSRALAVYALLLLPVAFRPRVGAYRGLNLVAVACHCCPSLVGAYRGLRLVAVSRCCCPSLPTQSLVLSTVVAVQTLSASRHEVAFYGSDGPFVDNHGRHPPRTGDIQSRRVGVYLPGTQPTPLLI